MRRLLLACLIVLALCAQSPAGTTVNEIARIQGQGELELRGIGLVVGLNHSGDSGKELAVARPLQQLYINSGNPVVIDDIKGATSVALVSVSCRVPETGARTGDRIDVRVQAMQSAKSLVGGTLYLCALQGPLPRDPLLSQVFALAEGPLVIEGSTPTTGRVREGARMIRDVKTGQVGDSFTIILRPPYAGWASTSEVASTITQNLYGKTGKNLAGLPQLATVLDDRSIRIDIPPAERANTAAFVGDVLSTPINVALLKLPAQVIYNEAAGRIVVTGDVEISPVAITQSDLTITTTVPPPTPTPDNPLLETKTWAGIAPGAKESDKARLQDLLNAFNQLKIPVREQIGILQMLEKTGKLHAKVVIE
jgi:flagellar P-ring protein precursor FlgI